MGMLENEAINGWTFEETIQCAENLMEEEKNIFKWDVLRHLRDFAENYKDEIQQYRAIGTIEEFKALKENQFFNFDSPVARIDKKSYDKAIEEFSERLKEKVSSHFRYRGIIKEPTEYEDYIDEIAETLKGVQ